MNIKKQLLFCVVILVGLVSINTFVFPKIEERCSCTIGEEIIQILCADSCPGEDCGVWMYIRGICDDMGCRSNLRIDCIPSGKRFYYYWHEPCWECSEW
jgi:hypothetical protein